jgi:flagellar hook-length control protein FliK
MQKAASVCRLYRELFMNKSVLPLTFDALSVTKSSMKKTVADAARQENFAEHLSQSQRELVKDKTTDQSRTSVDRQKPKTNRDTAPQSHAHAPQKKQLTQKSHTPEKSVAHQTGEAVHAEKKLNEEPQENTESIAEDSPETAGTEVMGLDIQKAGGIGKDEFEKNLELEVVLMDPALVLNPEKSVVQSESISAENVQSATTELPLQVAETLVPAIEIHTVKTDITPDTVEALTVDVVDNDKTRLEKLAGMQQPVSETVNTSVDTASPELISSPIAGESEIPVHAMTAPLSVPLVAEAKLPNQTVLIPLTEEIATGKNGMDLPLELMNADNSAHNEESANNLLELADFTGEIKMEDKSSKSDLFKSLIQLQTEKTPVAEKPATPVLQAAPLTTAQVTTANRLFVPQTQLGVGVAHPNWSHAMGEKILWMANQQLSSADIRLDPPELGSLQVKVNVQQDQANITFISPHPQVRELLDQQVTRLREMFAEQGLNLVNVDVADKREHQSRHADDESGAKGNFVNEGDDEFIESPVSSLYLVDLHA